MTNWKEYTFEELFEIPLRNGLNKPSKVRGAGYRMINMKEIFGYDFIDDSTPMELVPLSEREKENSFLQEGDLLFARQSLIASGAGKISIYRGSLPTVFESHLIRCRIDNKIALSKYVYYLVKSPYGRGKIETIVTQTAAAGIRGSELKNLRFNLPDLPTQTAIAEILSSLDDKIELNNKINQELENLAQTLFKQWFIDFEFPNQNGDPYKSSGGEMVDSELGEIPKGWEVGVLEDLIDFSNGNAFKSKELLKEDIGDCYHVFKMGHIKKGGGLNADGTKSFYEKSKTSKLKRYVLKVGDLLMCMTDMKGNVALLGHTALMNEDNKYIVNQRVGLLRPSNKLGIDFPYLYILTNSTHFIEDLRSRANSGVQVNLSTSEIKVSAVLLPPKDINIAFDKSLRPFFESIFNSTKENKELTNLRDTLLPKLISGELEVSKVKEG
jgi:type I restriction enzyme S subunit